MKLLDRTLLSDNIRNPPYQRCKQTQLQVLASSKKHLRFVKTYVFDFHQMIV